MSALADPRRTRITLPDVVGGIYKRTQHIGFAGGKMLEPPRASATFIGLMPATVAQASHITTIELDPLTSAIGNYSILRHPYQ